MPQPRQFHQRPPDGVNELVFADLPVDGKTTPVIMQANRNGFFYVLDRTNGKLLLAKPFLRRVDWAAEMPSSSGKVMLTVAL